MYSTANNSTSVHLTEVTRQRHRNRSCAQRPLHEEGKEDGGRGEEREGGREGKTEMHKSLLHVYLIS